jgi:hypothetical protein
MPGLVNNGSGPVIDFMGREIAPGAFIIHPDDQADQPNPLEGGATGDGTLEVSLTTQEQANAAAAAIAALGALDAVAAIAEVVDSAVLAALATDTRVTVTKAVAARQAALQTATS